MQWAACGAADATAWLTRRLSAGTPVTITYDSLQYDWYQRELGWVVTDDGKTVNVDLVRSLGADHVVDYTNTDVTRTEKRYDVILDNVEAQPLAAVRRALTPTGTLIPNS